MKIYAYLLCIILLFSYSVEAQNIVTIDKNQILVNGQVFKIKGICYNPIKAGKDRFSYLDFSRIDEDIALMKKACINTVRFYEPFDNKTVMDKFSAAGMMIVMNFPSYDDTKLYSDISSGSFIDYIEKYKQHPAILMWELGNEYNYHPEWFSNNINNWYKAMNDAAAKIHAVDTNHPVSTAHGEVPKASVLSACPEIDVWGMNIYRWDNPSGAISDFTALSTKPFYFSEIGADRLNNSTLKEDANSQAKALYSILKKVTSNSEISGAFIFEFVDELWKMGNPDTQDNGGIKNSVPYDNFANEEWFGVVDINRQSKIALDTIKSCFCIQTGIERISIHKSDKIQIFPNPAKDIIQVYVNEIFNLEGIEIFNSQGKIVQNYSVKQLSRTIPIHLVDNKGNKLSSGIYVLRLKGNSSRIHYKVVIE